MNQKKTVYWRKLVRNFVLELIVYTGLVIAYFLIVLRFLGQPLKALFGTNLPLYALVALGLIVVQGAVLESVTSFLVSRLGLERPE